MTYGRRMWLFMLRSDVNRRVFLFFSWKLANRRVWAGRFVIFVFAIDGPGPGWDYIYILMRGVAQGLAEL